ncbi:MAG: nuclear transport factor 2 family protein [Novosphingobium sp.]|nr:nuclear transport factor 2 family protein [Novosphingobium sp.]
MTEADSVADAAIRRTLAACTQAGDARKAEAYGACFTPDSVLDLGSKRVEGAEAIRLWMSAPSVIPRPQGGAPGFVSHHLTTCRIELTSPATATVRTYWLVIAAAGLDHSGYYDDRFRRMGDDWLIEYRRPRTLWIAANSVLGGEARDRLAFRQS